MDDIRINVGDLPTHPSAEYHAELLALAAQAGNWPGFLAESPEAGNPDEDWAGGAAARLWAEMRNDLGLPD